MFYIGGGGLIHKKIVAQGHSDLPPKFQRVKYEIR